MLKLCPPRRPALAFALAATLAAGPAAAETPFKLLEGAWSGSGRIVLDDGKSERLVCRANYSHRTSTTLGLSIRCASSSYKIELRAALATAGASVSGTWEERSFNAEGTIAGKASGTALDLGFRGNISGSMSVSVEDRQQRVTIRADGAFKGVSIVLSKS